MCKLRQADEKLTPSASILEVAKELGPSEATYHRWRNRYARIHPGEAKRLEELEREKVHQLLFRRGVKREVFNELLEARVLVEDHRDHYEHHGPHCALSCRIPAEFGANANLDRKVEDVRKPKELESIVTLS